MNNDGSANTPNRRTFLKSAAAAAGGISLAAFLPARCAQAEAAKKTGGWETLFDGKKLDKWDFNPKAWSVKDEELYSPGKGGNIFSKKKYQDFTLDIEFKMSKGCNSGVFVRMASRKDWLHSSMEIQVLDSHGKPKIGKHDCGAVYDALVPSVNAAKKAGEWNRYFITCFKNRVFISLNGIQIIDMDLNKWDTAHKNADGSRNKFRDPLKTSPCRPTASRFRTATSALRSLRLWANVLAADLKAQSAGTAESARPSAHLRSRFRARNARSRCRRARSAKRTTRSIFPPKALNAASAETSRAWSAK